MALALKYSNIDWEKIPSFLGEVTRVAKGKTQKDGEYPPNQTTSMSVLWH